MWFSQRYIVNIIVGNFSNTIIAWSSVLLTGRKESYSGRWCHVLNNMRVGLNYTLDFYIQGI